MNHGTNRRGRSFAVAAVAAFALVGLAGCSSGSDGGSSDAAVVTTDQATAQPTATDAATADGGTTARADDGTTAPADGASSGADSEGCGGLSAADVGAAVGAGEFDSAVDISIDADTSCLFSNSVGVYGVTVMSEPTGSYLAGELDGASTDDALSSLETVFTTSLDAPTVNRITVGGNDAIVVTGNLMTGGAGGKIGTVVDGVVFIVEADGSELASDPAGFEPIVTNVLALATSAG